MHGRLFVTHQNVFDFILLKKLIIKGQNRPTGIAKNSVNPTIS
jgi:hypothetical protein